MPRRDRSDNPREANRKIFFHAMIWAGAALVIILIASIFLAKPAAKKIQPITPTPHSQLRTVPSAAVSA